MTRRSITGWLLVLALWMAVPAHAAGIVFRYLPGEASLSSPVVKTGVEEGRFLDPRHALARGPGSWGLLPPFSAEFAAPGTTLRSASSDPLSQPLGPRLTAEAWVRPATLAGPAVLLTNRLGGTGGFVLGLADGAPYFSFHAGGRDVRVEAPRALAADASAWVAATAQYDAIGQRLTLALFVDGHRVATETVSQAIPSPYVIARPFFVGTTATGTPAEPVTTGAFSGHLFGAVVRDYVAAEAYLTSAVPHDGSPYLGLPAFLDQPLTSAHTPMDQQIHRNPVPPPHRFFLPFVNDGFVPQGVATRFDVSGGDTTALVYVAYYHLTRGGTTGQRRSMIAEMDAKTGHLRRAFRLRGTLGYSHAGGIAYAGGALFVSSSGTLERYPVPAYDPEGPLYADLEADADGTIATLSRASFVSAYDDTLWVGDWRTSAHEAPYVYGYPLAADGRPVAGVTPTIYALPRSIQGVDVLDHRGVRYMFMARNVSQSRGTAEVMRVPMSRLSRWNAPQPDTSVTLPHGIEDLSFFPDGTLWTNSESGAEYYQLTAQWSTFYPFVYSIPARELFGVDAVTSALPDERPAMGWLRAAPNPVHTATTLHFALPGGQPARLRITDALGRHVQTLLDGPVAGGVQSVRWQPDGLAPGLYFAVLEQGSLHAVRPLTLVR